MEDSIDQDLGNRGLTLTDKMKEDLRAASPWMKFVGIFYMIISALGLIGLLIAITQMFHISLVISLIIYGLMLYLGSLVMKMGNQYGNFLDTGTSATLEKAFDAQKRFWMITGILIILGIIALIVGIGYVQDLQESSNFG